MLPKISVIITSYNQKDYLIEAIDSVIAQTLKPYEVIIADDCSSDGSIDIIRQYKKKHQTLIKPIFRQKNLGISKNKSFAQKQVTGNWLTYLDGDDRFLPTKLEMEWQTLSENPSAKVVYSNFNYIDRRGNFIKKWNIDNNFPSGNIFIHVYTRAFPYNTVFRNELISIDCLKEIGYYDSNLLIYEDWDFKIRLSKKFEIVANPNSLIEYRIHPLGISSISHKDEILSQFISVYKKNTLYLKDYPFSKRKEVKNSIKSLISLQAVDVFRYYINKRKSSIRAFRFLLFYFRYINIIHFKKILLSIPFKRGDN